MTLSATNPMRIPLMSTLFFEVIVFGLAIPVMMMVGEVPAGLAAGCGGAAAVLALVAGMMMRRPQIGYPLGWLTQLAGFALGLLTYGMLIMAVLFTMLWVTCFVLGRRLEASSS